MLGYLQYAEMLDGQVLGDSNAESLVNELDSFAHLGVCPSASRRSPIIAQTCAQALLTRCCTRDHGKTKKATLTTVLNPRGNPAPPLPIITSSAGDPSLTLYEPLQ